MATKNGWWAAVLVVGMAVGCGEGGPTGTPPSATQKAAAQIADAGTSSIEITQGAANNAIVESGAPGATSSKAGAAEAPAGSAISYQASVSLTVDLDVLNSSGQDAFPNASGKFSVTANGTLSGDGMNGQVTYDVHVAWITDGVFSDPVCGASATIAAGSNWDYDLVIQWAKTDDLNWSIQAVADFSGSASAAVSHKGTTWTVSGTVTRHDTLAISRTAGNWALSFSNTGVKTVVVSNGTETHTVIFTMSALDHITIEVDGVVFGPYTMAQIRWWFGFNCNG